MTDSGTTLQPFIARGWSVRSRPGWKIYAKSPTGVVIAVDAFAGTATRMIAAAALVAEGHDLIGLLRDARAWIPRGYGGPGVAALNARVDAAIDAAEAAGKDGPQ